MDRWWSPLEVHRGNDTLVALKIAVEELTRCIKKKKRMCGSGDQSPRERLVTHQSLSRQKNTRSPGRRQTLACLGMLGRSPVNTGRQENISLSSSWFLHFFRISIVVNRWKNYGRNVVSGVCFVYGDDCETCLLS